MARPFKPKEDIEAKERILSQAVLLFSTKGFYGVSIDEIAKKAKVNKAMIYYHVGNKEVLYNTILENIFSKIVTKLEFHQHTNLDTFEKITAVMNTFNELQQEVPEYFYLFTRELMSGGKHVTQKLTKNVSMILSFITKALNQGKSENEIFKINPLSLHFLIIGSRLITTLSGPLRERLKQNKELFDDCGFEIPETQQITNEINSFILNGLKNMTKKDVK